MTLVRGINRLLRVLERAEEGCHNLGVKFTFICGCPYLKRALAGGFGPRVRCNGLSIIPCFCLGIPTTCPKPHILCVTAVKHDNAIVVEQIPRKNCNELHALSHGTWQTSSLARRLVLDLKEQPSTNSSRPDGRVRARRVPSPCRLRTAAVRTDVCAPGGYPAPAGYDSRRPDKRVSAPQQRPAQQHNTPSGHTGEQEPGGPGQRTRNTTHRAAHR